MKRLTTTLTFFAITVSQLVSAQFTESILSSFPFENNNHKIAIGDFTANSNGDIVSFRRRHSYNPVNEQYNIVDFSPYHSPEAKAIASADIDGDGFEDIIATERFNQLFRVFWYSNNGNGNVASVNIITSLVNGPDSLTMNNNELVVADFDGDGAADIAKTRGFAESGEYYSNAVEILHNMAGGQQWHYSEVASYGYFSESVTQLISGDLSGSGLPDLIYKLAPSFCDGPCDPAATVLYLAANNSNPGMISFDEPLAIGSGFTPYAILDVDNDGLSDIAGYDEVSNKLSWLQNIGANTFGAATPFYPFTSIPTMLMQAADVNSDGYTDIVVVINDLNNFKPLLVFFNNGQSGFEPLYQLGVPGFFNDLRLGDVTNDGYTDIVVSLSTGVRVYRQNDPCAPEAPTNLSATLTFGGVIASWTTFEGTSKCRLQRGTSFNGSYDFLTVTGTNINEAFIPIAYFAESTTYGWRVRCWCGGINPEPGPWSEIATYQLPTPFMEPDMGLNIFPNPSRGAVNISTNLTAYLITVFDLSGRLIFEQYSPSQSFLIDQGRLPAGIYMLHVQSEGLLERSKLVIAN